MGKTMFKELGDDFAARFAIDGKLSQVRCVYKDAGMTYSERGPLVCADDRGSSLVLLKGGVNGGRYLGRALVGGRERSKHFNGDKADVCGRFAAWADRLHDAESKNAGKEQEMGDANNGTMLIEAVRKLTEELHEMRDAIEAAALVIADSAQQKKEPKKAEAEDVLDDYFGSVDVRELYNTDSHQIYNRVRKWCAEHGVMKVPSSNAITRHVKKRFADQLDFTTTKNGTYFTFKKEA